MKTLRIAIAALSLIAISLVAPTFAVLPSIVTTWQGFTYHGFDPYYNAQITGFKTGSTASFTLSIDNVDRTNYINVTGAKLMLDWNQNVTPTVSLSKASPMRINPITVMPLTFSFQIPATTVATNLVRHTYNSYINFTGSGSIGTNDNYILYQQSFGSIWVLSSDQSDALTAAQQLPQALPGGANSYDYCAAFIFNFRTVEGSTQCQQSQQQANQAWGSYDLADFAAAKTSFQAAANNWNGALSADKSTGGNLELGQTVQGWGFLLLGIGSLVAGVAGILYAWKRPRELRGMTAPATH